MKKTFTFLFLLSGFFSFSQLNKVPVDEVRSDKLPEPGFEAFRTIDDDPATFYYSRSDQNSPDALDFFFTKEVTSIKKIVYTPAFIPDGRWQLLDVFYSTRSDPYKLIPIERGLRWEPNFDTNEIILAVAIPEPYSISFWVREAWNGFSSCAEMEFYSEDTPLFVPTVTKTYGDADYFPGNISADGVLVQSYSSSNTTIATIENNKVHIVGAGTAIITARLNDATTAQQTLTVNKAALTVTADNKTKSHGAENPVLTVSYLGFVKQEKASDLLTIPTAVTTATTFTEVGSYPITVDGGASNNYEFTYVKGTLTIEASLGTADFNKNNLTYYPNPVKDLWHVSFDKEITHITVVNFLGQTVAEKALHGTQGSVDLSGFAPGVYFIKVTAVNGTETIKVIKE